MAKFTPRDKGRTPLGVLVWPHLTDPDFGTEEYPVPDGSFNTKLRVPVAQAQGLMEDIDRRIEEQVELAKSQESNAAKRKKIGSLHSPYEEEFDAETGASTGNVLFKFKMPFRVTAKRGPNQGKTYEFRPAVILAATRKPIDEGVRVGSGSTAKVAFEFNPYYTSAAGAGVSLKLSSVLVFNLQTPGGSGGADDWGDDDFNEEEDERGYSGAGAADSDDDDESENPAPPGGDVDF